MGDFDKTLRLVKTVHIAFIGAALLYSFLGPAIAPKSSDPVEPQVFWTLSTVALLCAGIAFAMKSKLTASLEQQIREGATISKINSQRWVGGHFAAFTCSLAIVLFGFVLLFLGARLSQIIPFDVAGIALLVTFAPRLSQ